MKDKRKSLQSISKTNTNWLSLEVIDSLASKGKQMTIFFVHQFLSHTIFNGSSCVPACILQWHSMVANKSNLFLVFLVFHAVQHCSFCVYAERTTETYKWNQNQNQREKSNSKTQLLLAWIAVLWSRCSFLRHRISAIRAWYCCTSSGNFMRFLVLIRFSPFDSLIKCIISLDDNAH